LVTNDWKFSKIVTAFDLNPNDLVNALPEVDKLRIIDFRPPTGIKKLASRNFRWRKDWPVQEYFLRRVVSVLFAGQFDDTGDELRFVGASLSAASMLRLPAGVRKLTGEFEHLAQQDAR